MNDDAAARTDPCPSCRRKYLFSALAAVAALASPAAPTSAQGFAGLGTAAEGFASPSSEAVLSFPADHGPHPDHRVEWWYLTANLTGPDGTEYGIQWTLFRSALAPHDTGGWDSPQVWMGHAGLTAPEAHFVAERLARGGIGQAGVTAEPFEAWIDDWQMASAGGKAETLEALRLRATGESFSYDLSLRADGPIVLQGDGGYSVKSPEGQASHYYSQPFYQVSGNLTLPAGSVPVTGLGWLDREWSSQPLTETQDGWDWISLHFDSGAKLMGFRLRDSEGAPFTSATWIEPDGTATPYGNGSLTMTPGATSDVNGIAIPTEWQIDLPAHAVSVTIEALNPQSWMATRFPYWEGPVRITGSHTGRGYLEATGYGGD